MVYYHGKLYTWVVCSRCVVKNMIQTTIIEKEVPIKWNRGTTKVKVSFEVPIPIPISDDVKAMNIELEKTIKQSYQPIVDLLTNYLEIIQYGEISGAVVGIPTLYHAIMVSKNVMLTAIDNEKKNDEKWS